MAFKRFFHNNYTSSAMAADWAAALEDAIEYAGFDDLKVTVSDSTIRVFQGETAGTGNVFVSYYVSSESTLTVLMSDSLTVAKSFGLYVSVIATKKAVAFLGCMTDGTSNGGFIITKDTAGGYVLITNAAAGIAYQTLNSPKVMPRNTSLGSIPTLSVSTDYSYGVTTLCNFPVPNDGSAVKYLADVFMCVTGQIQTDGECVIDTTPYYCIGGGWYLKDEA